MNVYLLETGVIQKDGNFFWYNIELYSSKSKLLHRINNSIDVNKGYDVKFYDAPVKLDPYKYCDYSCISTDGRPMDIFLRYKKVKVN